MIFNSLDEKKINPSQRRALLHIVSLGQQSCGYSGKVRWMDFNTPQQTNYEDCGSYATFCILNQLYKRSDFTEVDQLKAFGESADARHDG